MKIVCRREREEGKARSRRATLVDRGVTGRRWEKERFRSHGESKKVVCSDEDGKRKYSRQRKNRGIRIVSARWRENEKEKGRNCGEWGGAEGGGRAGVEKSFKRCDALRTY